jgi:arylsulfatase A-like enzyme/Flp pilus assembly protein TadD
MKRSAKALALRFRFTLALVMLSGCVWLRPSTRIETGSCGGCNVLLMTIDTLRTDRVGAFGSRRGLTPNLDRLAAEGLRFTRAYTSAPLTLPAHASILTGSHPPVHGLRANGLFRLGPTVPTLATVLKSAGYRTGAFVGSFVLDARFGLNRGFDVYDDRYGERHADDGTEGAERRAEEVMKPALDWILGQSGNQSAIRNPQSATPWLAWVHFYDPHDPYRAPEPYASKFEPYDAEVAYTDATLGRLLDSLRAAGQLERTLVVVAADHGESLGEHGERTHGVFAYDVTIRVPWVLWAGDRLKGASDALVRLVDLAPTVLDLVGVAPPREFGGASVVHRVRDGATELPAYFEAMDANLTRNWAPLAGIVSGRHKLIDLPKPELYDLAADPGESTNLFASDAERARTLDAVLRSTIHELGSSGSAAGRATLSAEARQRLQALGYVASSAEPGKRVYTDADDPKNLIGVSDALNRAVSAFNVGERQRAMADVRTIMRDHPGFSTAFGMYASMQRRSGDLPGAIATLEDIVRRNIADARVLVTLAGYLEESGAHDKAIGVLQAVIAAHPDFADAYGSLGAVYSQAGRHVEARAALRRVLELDPSSATAYENLGVDELRAGERAAAIADLNRALELDPLLSIAHNAIATALMLEGRKDEAIEHWRQAVAANPRSYDALFNLATALHQEGRLDEARPYIERFVREAPPARYGRDIQQLQSWLAR